MDLSKLGHGDIIVEAVVSPYSELVKKSVKQTRFRTRFNAVILAVHRYGARVDMKIGDIVLEVGWGPGGAGVELA